MQKKSVASPTPSLTYDELEGILRATSNVRLCIHSLKDKKLDPQSPQYGDLKNDIEILVRCKQFKILYELGKNLGTVVSGQIAGFTPDQRLFCATLLNTLISQKPYQKPDIIFEIFNPVLDALATQTLPGPLNRELAKACLTLATVYPIIVSNNSRFLTDILTMIDAACKEVPKAVLDSGRYPPGFFALSDNGENTLQALTAMQKLVMQNPPNKVILTSAAFKSCFTRIATCDGPLPFEVRLMVAYTVLTQCSHIPRTHDHQTELFLLKLLEDINKGNVPISQDGIERVNVLKAIKGIINIDPSAKHSLPLGRLLHDTLAIAGSDEQVKLMCSDILVQILPPNITREPTKKEAEERYLCLAWVCRKNNETSTYEYRIIKAILKSKFDVVCSKLDLEATHEMLMTVLEALHRPVNIQEPLKRKTFVFKSLLGLPERKFKAYLSIRPEYSIRKLFSPFPGTQTLVDTDTCHGPHLETRIVDARPLWRHAANVDPDQVRMCVNEMGGSNLNQKYWAMEALFKSKTPIGSEIKREVREWRRQSGRADDQLTLGTWFASSNVGVSFEGEDQSIIDDIMVSHRQRVQQYKNEQGGGGGGPGCGGGG